MKAAVLTEINKPLEIKDVQLTDLKFGQVLVKIIMSGICGSQLHEIKGHKGNAKFLPHLMGHEGCGIVQEIGPGVTNVKVGDKVVMHWRVGAGIESPFPTYVMDGKSISSGKVTTLSEYSIVSENRLTSVPIDTPPELCSILGCALTTALGIIDNETDLKFGESVAIIGTGGVGLNLIQAAKLKGAGHIIAIDLNLSKKDACILLGADEFCQTIYEVKEKVDVIIDTTGLANIFDESVKHLSNNGRLILVGQPSPNVAFTVSNALQLFNGRGLSVKATQGGKTVPQDDIPRYIRLYNRGRLNIDDLISHRFKLDQVNQAFELLKTGYAKRIIIEMETL